MRTSSSASRSRWAASDQLRPAAGASEAPGGEVEADPGTDALGPVVDEPGGDGVLDRVTGRLVDGDLDTVDASRPRSIEHLPHLGQRLLIDPLQLVSARRWRMTCRPTPLHEDAVVADRGRIELTSGTDGAHVCALLQPPGVDDRFAGIGAAA